MNTKLINFYFIHNFNALNKLFQSSYAHLLVWIANSNETYYKKSMSIKTSISE